MIRTQSILSKLLTPRYSIDWDGFSSVISTKVVQKINEQGYVLESETLIFEQIKATMTWLFSQKPGVIPVKKDQQGRLVIQTKSRGPLKFDLKTQVQGSLFSKEELRDLASTVWKSKHWVVANHG